MYIKNLVFSGGGIKGIAYIGVIRFLEESKLYKNICAVAGTSIGALISFMFVIGLNSFEIYKISNDFNSLYSICLKQLFINYSFDTREKIDAFIKNIFINKNIPINITFSQLYELTKIELYISTTNLNTYSERIFNWKDSPNVNVFEALIMSMNLPIYWKKVVFEGDHYVDGGLTNNFPLNIFLHKQKETIGFTLKNTKNIENIRKEINSFEDYFTNIITCLFKHKSSMQYYNNNFNIIYIDCNNINTIDFSIDNNTKDLLIQKGYNAISQWFKKNE